MAKIELGFKFRCRQDGWQDGPEHFVPKRCGALRLWAMCGRLSVGKGILMFCPSVGAAMCAAC